MLMVLHPTYTLRVRIQDRSDLQAGMGMGSAGIAGSAPQKPYRYYDSMTGKTGCDDVLAAVKEALSKAGVKADVSLESFKHEG